MKKKRKILTQSEMDAINEKRKIYSENEYTLGRVVVRIKDWACRPSGSIGWIISTWPETRVLFEDNVLVDLHTDEAETIQVVDEWCDDVPALRRKIEIAADKKYNKGAKRKASYE